MTSHSAIPLWIFLSTSNGSVSTRVLVCFNHKFMDLFQLETFGLFQPQRQIDLFQSTSNGSVSTRDIWSISTTNTNGSVSIYNDKWICSNCKIPWVSLNLIHIFIQYIYGSILTTMSNMDLFQPLTRNNSKSNSDSKD